VAQIWMQIPIKLAQFSLTVNTHQALTYLHSLNPNSVLDAVAKGVFAPHTWGVFFADFKQLFYDANVQSIIASKL